MHRKKPLQATLAWYGLNLMTIFPIWSYPTWSMCHLYSCLKSADSVVVYLFCWIQNWYQCTISKNEHISYYRTTRCTIGRNTLFNPLPIEQFSENEIHWKPNACALFCIVSFQQNKKENHPELFRTFCSQLDLKNVLRNIRWIIDICMY